VATKKTDETSKVLAKIDAWPDEQREIGERLHNIIMAAAPDLRPKLYYGQPGYARSGPVLVFFRNDEGLMSFAFTEKAAFSTSSPLVASAWFVNRVDADAEEKITAIVRETTA
jgi:hypothetical protein